MSVASVGLYVAEILNRAWANVSLVPTATEDLLEWSHLKWLIFLEWMFSPTLH